mmetsp:Transcript_46824/g.124350  ORF Transcript_46824/g.124350 Transcript_46824/m.124350 type:complete len:206 (+) Transcript_46824:196-813(+)
MPRQRFGSSMVNMSALSGACRALKTPLPTMASLRGLIEEISHLVRAKGSALRTGCQWARETSRRRHNAEERKHQPKRFSNNDSRGSSSAFWVFRHQRTHRFSNLPQKVLLLLTFTHLRSRRHRLPHASFVRTVLHPRSPTQRGDARSLPQIRKVGFQDGPQAESRHVGTSNASGLTFNDIDHASRLLDSEASRPDNHVLEVTARA